MATRTHTLSPVDIDWTIVHDDGVRKQFVNELLGSGIDYDQELTKLFLDLDLSILGSSSDQYDAYSRKIRQEYIQYPWDTYRSRRIEIMQRFLARPQLFFTDTFYAKYEATARQNIKREITLLQAAVTQDHFLKDS